MQKRDFQKRLEALLDDCQRQGRTPTLLLHSCCAPCSSYVISYLAAYFRITVFYYNPNIHPQAEYLKRKAEQIRLIHEMPVPHPVGWLDADYSPPAFFEAIRGREACREGGERCFACYALRLRQTAIKAREMGADYFASTLSVSPHKNAQKINEIGEALAQELGVQWLYNDFKKREGYKRSIALSAQFSLYRQNYCGCVFSMPTPTATLA